MTAEQKTKVEQEARRWYEIKKFSSSMRADIPSFIAGAEYLSTLSEPEDEGIDWNAIEEEFCNLVIADYFDEPEDIVKWFKSQLSK